MASHSLGGLLWCTTLQGLSGHLNSQIAPGLPLALRLRNFLSREPSEECPSQRASPEGPFENLMKAVDPSPPENKCK